MSAAWLITIFILVFVGIALLIVKLRINPAISLLIGTIVLGLASGMSFDDVIEGVNGGFGSLMADVGLLITLGVIMGYLMSSYGAVQRIVQGIVALFRTRGAPYAFSLTLTTITPSIYFDVLLVIVAPIARSVARRTGRPIASVAGPVAIGLAAGNAFVLPGAAVLAYIGMLEVSPAEMLLPGLAVAVPAVAITTYLYVFAMERLRWWRPQGDEDPGVEDILIDSAAGAGGDAPAEKAQGVQSVQTEVRLPSMAASLAPVLVVLVLILGSIVAPLVGIQLAVIGFLGSPIIALLAGALTALIITVAKKSLDDQEREINRALEMSGTILVVTAVSGSLGSIIAGTGMQDTLSGLFGASSVAPLLAVWAIAAVMRASIGSMTVAGITAIGIIAPLISGLGLSPVLVILAAGAGGCFGGQFSDNAFWVVRSLFGLSTRGTLKTYTLAQSLLSIVVLVFVLVVDLFV